MKAKIDLRQYPKNYKEINSSKIKELFRVDEYDDEAGRYDRYGAILKDGSVVKFFDLPQDIKKEFDNKPARFKYLDYRMTHRYVDEGYYELEHFVFDFDGKTIEVDDYVESEAYYRACEKYLNDNVKITRK